MSKANDLFLLDFISDKSGRCRHFKTQFNFNILVTTAYICTVFGINVRTKKNIPETVLLSAFPYQYVTIALSNSNISAGN